MAAENFSGVDSLRQSGAEMHDEKSALYQEIVKLVTKLPSETKEFLRTLEGLSEVQKIFDRSCKGLLDKGRAEQKTAEKILGFGTRNLETFLSAIKEIKATSKNGESPRPQVIADFDACLFALLKRSESRDSLVRGLSPRLTIACPENDHVFFKKLGRALTAKAKSSHDSYHLPKLDKLLLGNWVAKKGCDPTPGLCHFSDSALLDFCKLQLDQKNLTATALTKCRQRLGLKQSAKPLITKVRRDKDGIWLTKGGQKFVQNVVQSKKPASQ